jgi:hypothetical protein
MIDHACERFHDADKKDGTADITLGRPTAYLKWLREQAITADTALQRVVRVIDRGDPGGESLAKPECGDGGVNGGPRNTVKGLSLVKHK